MKIKQGYKMIFVVCIIASLTACSAKTSSQTNATETISEKIETQQQTEKTTSVMNEELANNEGNSAVSLGIVEDEPEEANPTIEETIILSDDDLEITVSSENANEEVNYFIENKAGFKIDVWPSYYAVNGIENDDWISQEKAKVPAGKKANLKTKTSRFMDRNEIANAEYIDIYLYITNEDRGDILYQESFRVPTSHYNGDIERDLGKCVREDYGIKVYPNIISDTEAEIRIQNKQDQVYGFRVRDLCINDYVTGSTYTPEILLPHSTLTIKLDYGKDFLEDNNIEKIEKYDFNIDYWNDGEDRPEHRNTGTIKISTE